MAIPWIEAIGAGVTSYEQTVSAREAEAVTEQAIQREWEASQEAMQRQHQSYRNAQAALGPFAAQELAASQQMMTQLGMGQPQPQPYATSDPSQPYVVPQGTSLMGVGDAAFQEGFGGPAVGGANDPRVVENSFLSGLMAESIAAAGRAGYGSNKKPEEAINEGARAAVVHLQALEDAGRLPEGMTVPTENDLRTFGTPLVDAGGGLEQMREGLLPGYSSREDPSGTTWGSADVDRMLEQFYPQVPQAAAGQPLPGQQMGGAPPPAAGAVPGTGPGGARTAGDIMALAGVEGLPEGFQEQYFGDLAGAGAPIDIGFGTDFRDPEFQSYMGLTQESMRPTGYQDSPAYAAAREAGMEAVNQGAAASGGLYSGRRGEALRDVGQEVEQKYYFDAADRLQQMMEARRGEYGTEVERRETLRSEDLARRGDAYQSGQTRAQSYYNNYMEMLSGISGPTTTTNLAQLEANIGKSTGATLMDASRDVSDLEIGLASRDQAARADQMGGLVDLGTAFLEGEEGY